MNAKELWNVHEAITYLQRVNDILSEEFVSNARVVVPHLASSLPFQKTFLSRAKKFRRTTILAKLLRLFVTRNFPNLPINDTTDRYKEMLLEAADTLLEMSSLMEELCEALKKTDSQQTSLE